MPPFEAATDAAIEEVNSPSTPNSGSESSGTPEIETEKEAPSTESPPSQAQTPQDLLDLAKLGSGKFKFEGKEMSYEELKAAYLRHDDYTRKTQALAEERKFHDNLETDLAAVQKDPSLAAQFKQIYPERFHRYLGFVGNGQSGQPVPQAQSAPQANLPPELAEKFKVLEDLQGKVSRFEAESSQAQQETLDNMFSTLEGDNQKKYPKADMIHVYGAISDYLEKHRLSSKDLIKNRQATQKMFEQFSEASHLAMQKKHDEWKKAELETIRATHAKASDMGRGGGTPSGAPKKYSRLSDVADDIIASDINSH